MKPGNTIGIIGTGNFGTVLRIIMPQIFPKAHVIIMDRASLDNVSACDLVIPAVPTHFFEEVINSIKNRLKPESILMDVCSVKGYPKKVALSLLPKEIDILSTHPMFGPGTLEKTNGSLQNLKIVIDTVRIDPEKYANIKASLERAGLIVVEMDADEHDRLAGQFHFTSHIIAQLLKDSTIKKSPIDTESVSLLHDFAAMVRSDSTSLLQDMYQYNPYCKDQFKEITRSFSTITQLLK